MKVLQIVSSAYRATIEEQDDTILWLTQAMKTAGGDLDVLLTENAVSYGLLGQDASGVTFGAWQQTQPPRVDGDIARMLTKGINIYVVSDDLDERGLDACHMVEGIRRISQVDVAKLIAAYDRVWRW